MASPVTVSITRHVDPGHEGEMVAWLQAGFRMLEGFPGFLGGGWVRPESDSHTWHVLYRFADHDTLAQWEHSSERSWWRSAAHGLGVTESRVERRTGIEGWFDEPESADVQDLDAVPAAPPRWKQALTIFLVFYPLSVLANALLPHTPVVDLPLPLRVLATVAVMTPLMTYVLLPWITRRLQWFLQGRPAPWRRDAAGTAPLGSDA